MLASADKARDIDAKSGGQEETARAEGQKSEDQRGPESESGDPRPAGSGPELEDK